MASGLQSYTATFSGDFTSFVAGKVINAAKNAKQEKENQKKAEELGIEVPAEEKKGLFKRALGYEFGGRRFDRTVGSFLKNKSSEEVSNKSKFADQFSYTKALKKGGKNKPASPISTTGKTTTKKGQGRFNFTKGFGQIALELELLNNKVSSLVAVANKQLGATYRTSGGLAGIQKILLEQNNIQKEARDDAKAQQEEASMDATKDTSASDAYKSTFDQTPGWNDETGQPEPIAPAGSSPSVPGGEDGGGLGTALDIADTALDLGKAAKVLGKRGKGRALTRAGAAIGGKRGAKIGSKVAGFGSKFFGKSAGKAAGKGIAKAAGKGIAKGVGKSLVKKIPIIGAIAGLGFGIQRAMQGDWLGAAGEVASGVASTVPGAGTAVSAGIDAALIGKDVASESAQPQAEGGVMPLSSAVSKNILPSLIPGIGPALSAGMAMNDMSGGAVEDAAKMPFKAVGGAMLAVTSGFIKALGPVAGLVAPMIKQETAPLARLLGMPSSLVKFGGIGGAALQSSSAAQKEGMNFLSNFMNSALEKLGLKPKKEENQSSSGGGGGGGGGGGTPSSTDDTSTDDSGTGGAPPDAEPGKRIMTADEYAAKITSEVKGEKVGETTGRGGGKPIFGVKDKRLSVVKNSENQSETSYYHDTFGQLYKMDSNQKMVRVSQEEISAGAGDWSTGKWDFFRKPDKNVVLGRLESMPVGSIKLANRQIVYQKPDNGRNAGAKALREPTEDERKKYGIDQIKSPFGSASSTVPQIQAASGISVTSNGGGNKQLSPGRTFGYADLNPHHSDEGRTRVYGGMSIGVPKDYGMGVLPNYMPSGPNGRVPLPVAGKVLVKEWNRQSGYGRTVIVETNLGKMQFSHLSKFGKFNVGDRLSPGTIIGTQGGSGNRGEKDYEDHLHLNATKRGHEAFVNFITSGKPTTGMMDDTDSPSNEDAGNTGDTQEPEDPMERFKQNISAALSGVAKLRALDQGKSWEEVKAEPDKSWDELFAPAESSSTPSTGTPSTNKPNVKPGATAPAATAPPAKPSRSPASAPSAVSATPASFVPLPIASATPGGAGSFHVRATDIGTAESLRPQLASYIG